MAVIERLASHPNPDAAADLHAFLDSAAIHDRADRVDIRTQGTLLASGIDGNWDFERSTGSEARHR
jgi:hypothetical protein